MNLHAYWMAHPQERAVQQQIKARETGHNGGRPCGGDEFKQCCLH
ncbi:hypothetical protein ACNKHV_11990 [Shigella flexneri]